MSSPSSSPQFALLRIWLMFLKNGLVREMTFRWNFFVNILTRGFWFAAQLVYFELIFGKVGDIAGWTRPQYYAFMATGMLINSLIEMFFMPNLAHLSELIRTGNLDFALLKPIDAQFLISCEKVELGMTGQMLLSVSLLTYSLILIGSPVTVSQVLAYLVLVAAGVTLFYSLMISLACTSLFFGRNTGLYDFWFYVTNFARYPRSIYDGVDPARWEPGEVLQAALTWIVPVLLVVTVPAQAIAGVFMSWHLPVISLVAAALGLMVSRRIFQWSLRRYRSASS